MTRVDFYVLKQSGEDARRQFCCKLVEKAYALDNTVHIQVADATTARILDELLWAFRDDSFLPHSVADAESADAPISIGYGDLSAAKTLLVNLTDEMPESSGQFERIAEIVSADEPVKVASRQRFALYRERRYDIETHKL